MSSKKKVTKDALIKSIAAISGRDVFAVKDVLNAMEDVLFDYVSSVDEKNTEISIKLFEGVSFDAKYMPEKVKINNLTGKSTSVSSKIKPKFNITRTYCEKLNSRK